MIDRKDVLFIIPTHHKTRLIMVCIEGISFQLAGGFFSKCRKDNAKNLNDEPNVLLALKFHPNSTLK